MPVFGPSVTAVTSVSSSVYFPCQASGGAENEINALGIFASGADQGTAASGAGTALNIKSQSAGSGNTNGADLILTPGTKSGSGAHGTTRIIGLSGQNALSIEGTTGTALFNSAGTLIVPGILFPASADYGYVSNTGITLTKNVSGVDFGWGSVPGSRDTAISRPVVKVIALTDGLNAGATLRSVPLAVTFAASQNDYNVGVGLFINLTASNAATSITGFSVSQVDGQIMIIRNVGSNAFTISNQSGSSSAANRVLFATGADTVVAANGNVRLRYDATASRWFDW